MSYNWETNKSIGSILSRKIEVPPYQREYSWGETEAEDYFDDIKSFSESGEDSYLFGQMIFYEKDGTYYVIDGQQRLATSIILTSIVNKIFSSLSLDASRSKYKKLGGLLVNCIGDEEDDGGYNFKLGGKGNIYFEKYIQNPTGVPTTSGIYTSTKNIKKVYDVLKTKIDAEIEDCKSDQEIFDVIDKLVRAVLDKFKVAVITTQELSQAYSIFETLNSRGKDLSASDLIKNYFFMHCKTGLDLIEEKWLEMHDNLDALELSTTDYIRSVWNGKYGFVRERELYREVSHVLTEEKSIKEFLNLLYDNYLYFTAFSNPFGINPINNNKIRTKLDIINGVNVKIHRPLIFSCFIKGYEDSKILSLLTSVENLIIRNIIVCSKRGNTYEKLFSELAICISNDSKTIDDAIAEINEAIVDDEMLKVNFANFDPTDAIARVILKEIYDFENKGEINIISDKKEVSVEHVMPVKISKWDVDKAIHKKYLNYLGNKTLLRSEDNTKASNNSFEIKKETYARSKLSQNHYFLTFDEWNEIHIEERQEVLFDTVKLRWNVP